MFSAPLFLVGISVPVKILKQDPDSSFIFFQNALQLQVILQQILHYGGCKVDRWLPLAEDQGPDQLRVVHPPIDVLESRL